MNTQKRKGVISTDFTFNFVTTTAYFEMWLSHTAFDESAKKIRKKIASHVPCIKP